MAKLGRISRYFKIMLSYYLRRPLYKPDLVAIVVSGACNLRCKMCDFWKRSSRQLRVLSVGQYQALFTDLKRYGVRKVQFTGGEPLLRRDFWDILKIAREAKLETIVITNATLIDESAADILIRNTDKIIVSLDTPEKERHDYVRGAEGAFDKVRSSLLLLTAAKRRSGSKKPLITITSTITPFSLHDPERMHDFAEQLGIDSIIYNPASTVSGYASLVDGFSGDASCMKGYDEMIDDIIRLMEKPRNLIRSNPFYLESSKHFLRHDKKHYLFSCYSGGYDGPHIDINGDVHPCCSWTVSLGNITEKPFGEIWKSKKAKEVRNMIRIQRCPVCYHHTRTFDYVLHAPLLHSGNVRKLIRGYKKLLTS